MLRISYRFCKQGLGEFGKMTKKINFCQTVTGSINYNSLDVKLQERNLWTYYQSKLSAEMVIAYIVSDSQVIQSPTKTTGQDESERSISVQSILNHHHLPWKFQQSLC
jgi:hypothetical protein